MGIAAFTTSRPGEVVVEPHTEVSDGRGQQEVYVVLRGSARFVIDGTVLEAPAGTILRVDASAHREATAIQANTAVLALGGDSTFRASASEWIERARPHTRSDPDRAAEILQGLKRSLPDDRANDVGRALLAGGRDDESTARSIVTRLTAECPPITAILATDPDLHHLVRQH